MYRIKTIFLICVLLFLIPSVSYAGVNVEARRAGVEKPGAFGDLQINGSLQYGNTNLINLGASGLAGFRHNRYTILGFGNVSFTSEDLFDKKEKRSIQNSEMFHLRNDILINRWFHWEIFTQAEADQNTAVKFRYLLGTGPRAFLYKDDSFTFLMGTSYMPEYENLGSNVVSPYPSGQINKKTWVHRWNNYASFRVAIKDQFTIQSSVYVQPRFDRFKDVKVFNDTVLTIAINEMLDFNVSFGVSYDQEPPKVCDSECKRLNKIDLGTQIGVRTKF